MSELIGMVEFTAAATPWMRLKLVWYTFLTVAIPASAAMTLGARPELVLPVVVALILPSQLLAYRLFARRPIDIDSDDPEECYAELKRDPESLVPIPGLRDPGRVHDIIRRFAYVEFLGTVTPQLSVLDTFGRDLVRTTVEVMKRPGSDVVLLVGERGTGKSALARLLLEATGRTAEHLLWVDTHRIPGQYLNETFAYCLMDYAASAEHRVGRISTIVLDEMRNDLFERSFSPIQAQLATFDADVIVTVDRAALVHTMTGPSLKHFHHARGSRGGIYWEVALPSLRNRRADIPSLAQQLARRFAEVIARPPVLINDEALAALQEFDWPGNLRQFESVMRWSISRATDQLYLELLPDAIRRGRLAGNQASATEEWLRTAFLAAQRHALGRRVALNRGKKESAAARYAAFIAPQVAELAALLSTEELESMLPGMGFPHFSNKRRLRDIATALSRALRLPTFERWIVHARLAHEGRE